jgi:MFS family permease
MNKNFYLDNAQWLLAGALLTFSTAFGQTFFISLFATEIRTHFNISHSLWGAIYAIGTFSSAALMLVLGGLADRYRAQPLALMIMGLFMLSSFLMSTVSTVWMLPFIIFGLRFCGQGMLSHLAMVFAGRWFAKNRGRTIGIISLGLSISEAILPYIFVFLMGLIGWRGSWGVATISIAILAIPLAILLSKERNPQSSGDGNTQKQTGMLGRHWTRPDVLRHWVFWAALPALLVQPIFSTTFFFQQVYFTEIKEWPLEIYVALIPIYTVTSLTGLLLGSVIIDRFSTSILLPIYLIPMALGFLISALADTLIGAGVCFACLGLMQGLGATVQGAFWPEFFGTKHLGSVRSVAMSLMVFASAIGPLTSGYLIDTGFNLEKQYVVMAFITLLSCGGMLSVSLGTRQSLK